GSRPHHTRPGHPADTHPRSADVCWRRTGCQCSDQRRLQPRYAARVPGRFPARNDNGPAKVPEPQKLLRRRLLGSRALLHYLPVARRRPPGL
ncbi:MAG: hypothetical protein AVDCRST_MAG58-2682, partial [uncultured Rubrobacteraceae bacterium]